MRTVVGLGSVAGVIALVASGLAASAVAQGEATPLEESGPLAAGRYSATPFVMPGSALCLKLPQPGCSETPEDDDLRLTFTVPEGWTGLDGWIRGGAISFDACHTLVHHADRSGVSSGSGKTMTSVDADGG